MKVIISIFLFFLFLSQTFSSFVLDSTYWLNQNYVAQYLCINKAKPQLHCNGKCYLSKQVEKENKDNAQQTGYKKEKANEAYFCKPSESVMHNATAFEAIFYHTLTDISVRDYHSSLYKPPQSFFV